MGEYTHLDAVFTLMTSANASCSSSAFSTQMTSSKSSSWALVGVSVRCSRPGLMHHHRAELAHLGVHAQLIVTSPCECNGNRRGSPRYRSSEAGEPPVCT